MVLLTTGERERYSAFIEKFKALPFRLDAPCQTDSWLLHTLGLPFNWTAGWEPREIGTIEVHDGKVTISCSALPAMFWTFDIVTCEDYCYRLSTGSGKLADYWPAVELVVQGLLKIERVE